MTRTLNAGQHQLVFTRGVNDKMAEDADFSRFVYKSILRFNRADWGDVCDEDKAQNDADLKWLNNGGWNGRILASYAYTKCYVDCHKITVWIIRNSTTTSRLASASNQNQYIFNTQEDGTQAITVLFPSEY